MKTGRASFLPRVLRLWALHLLMAAVGAATMSISGLIQSVSSSEMAALVSLATGVLVTALYFLLFARVSREMLTSLIEGLLFGLAGALPLVLIILAAVLYLQQIPYNTIGYSYILLPVMLPFIGWIEYVFPHLPYHILALAVPVIFAGAVIAGSLMRKSKISAHLTTNL